MLVVVLIAVPAWVFVAEPFRIAGTSMTPTLADGERVLVDKRAYRSQLPRRGDLVAFRAPPSGAVTIKRAVGLPGDSVAIEDGVLVVDERPRREPYADPDAIDSVYFGPVRVASGSVFVLGDNRADSIDSRDFGAVRRADLLGRVRLRLWPPGGWGEPNRRVRKSATRMRALHPVWPGGGRSS